MRTERETRSLLILANTLVSAISTVISLVNIVVVVWLH